ncbi:MAG: EamA family transporter [Alphaproteobacteria bacterium]|nr:MAG: EamA family transporter [Alphaproteobacteria bacterium]
MDPFVFAAVLVAAACHAAWNALIKIRLDPFLAIVLISAMAGIVALPLLLYVPVPPPAAWPWLALSVAAHLGYYIGLSGAYRAGDMGQVYPIARGTAPLMTAAGGALLLGENFNVVGWGGIFALTSGIFLLSLRGGGEFAHLNRRAVGYALFTAVTICCYSLVDGQGARTAGNAHSYALWLFVIDGAFITGVALLRHGTGVVPGVLRFWKSGLIGGTLSLAAYWIVIWAMTVQPIAIVAALRETSVLFAALIAVAILKEPLRASRVVAAVLIVAGLAAIRLQ